MIVVVVVAVLLLVVVNVLIVGRLSGEHPLGTAKSDVPSGAVVFGELGKAPGVQITIPRLQPQKTNKQTNKP